MRRRGLLAGLICLPPVVLGAATCVAVIGADQDSKDVADALCTCDEMTKFRPKAACAAIVRDRLENATPDVRAEWLTKYANECSKCREPLRCWLTTPLCAAPGSSCTVDQDCCSYRADGGPQCAELRCVDTAPL